MKIIDKDRFIEAFLGDGSYKHLNTLVPVVSSKYEYEALPLIEDWMNVPNNLKWLVFLESLLHPDKCTEAYYQAYQQLLQRVSSGERISVEEWQNLTKGTCILYANGQYFANTYVALAMCILINQDVLEILRPKIQELTQQYKEECDILAKIAPETFLSEILPYACAKSFDDIRWYYERFCGKSTIPRYQQDFFQRSLNLAITYLK